MSDWGRPSNASNPARRRGPGILALAIMLVLGAGLGSAGLLYLERSNLVKIPGETLADVSKELEIQVRENAELKRQLATQGDNAGDAIDLRDVLEEQESIIAGLREENRVLNERAGNSSAEPTTSANEETAKQLTDKIGQLEAGLALAGQVNSEMEGRLKKADQDIGELQARLELAEQLTNDLQSRLSNADGNASPEIDNSPIPDAASAELEAKLKLAEQINSELEQKLKIADNAVAETENRLKLAEQVTAGLQDELTLAKQASSETGSQLQSDRQANADIEQRLGEAEAALKSAENRLESTSRLKAEADERLNLAEQLNNELQTKLDTAFNTDIPALNQKLVSARAFGADKDAENTKLREDISRLEKENAQLLTSKEPATTPAAVPEVPTISTDAAPTERTPRDPLLVATAMQQAAGLDNLDNDERDRIATRLIEGDCVGQTLKDELGRVSAITLRDLISAFESDC